MSAAHGIVKSHDNKMPRTTRTFAFPVVNPIPNREPTETCVVETGSPYLLARITRIPVERLAENPCPWFIAVIFKLIVSATFFAFRSPPIAIATATATSPQREERRTGQTMSCHGSFLRFHTCARHATISLP